MAVVAKPFDVSESIVRSVFKGRPGVFSAEDLNRQFDSIDYALRRASLSVGLIRSNWEIVLNSGSSYNRNPTVPGIGNVYSVHMKFNLEKTDNNLPARVYAKGCEIEIAETSFDKTLTFAHPWSIGVYLFLIAKRHTVTFAEDPVMSGISASEHPDPIASSDTVVYTDARLVLAKDGGDADLVLATEEELIGILWSYTQAVTYSYGSSSLSLAEKYHATLFSDILVSIPFIDPVNNRYSYFLHNNSLVDCILQMQKSFNDRVAKIEAYMTAFSALPVVISDEDLDSYISLDTSFTLLPFDNAYGDLNALTYRKMFNRMFLDFKLHFLCTTRPTPCPAQIYFRIPDGKVALATADAAGFVTFQVTHENANQTLTFCKISTVRGAAYVKITPLFFLDNSSAPITIAASNIDWFGYTNQGENYYCDVHGSISIEITDAGTSFTIEEGEEIEPPTGME